MTVTTQAKILIVEDEIKLANVLAKYFEQMGYQVELIHHGAQVMGYFNSNHIDLIILDLGLPGQDGLSLCKAIRAQSEVPIMMTTARVEEIDRLLGLELGADDYICKPYSPREVCARAKAVLRRVQPSTNNETSNHWQLNENQLSVSFAQVEVQLTAVEFGLLATMVAKPNRIFSRDSLMHAAYSDDRIVSHRTIDSHIKKLRKKLEQLPASENKLHSVYGVGYKYGI